MRYLIQYLELIKVVHDNYNHIQQMETLIQMFDNLQSSVWLEVEDINLLAIVAKTTVNSHYNYDYLTSELYTNPENHVNVVYKAKYIAEYGQPEYDKWHKA